MQVKVASLLMLLPLLAVASPTPEPIQSIPLTKRSFTKEDGTADIARLNAHLGNVRAKIDRGFDNFKANTGTTHPNDKGTLKSKLAKRKTGKDGLTDDLDGELWQGNINVGTPANTFSVDFDTGSSDLFLPGTKCTGSACQGHKIFNTAQSSTAVDQHKTFSIEFGDGSTVSGEVFKDTVSIAGLTATSQAVVAASKYSDEFAKSESPPDGLLGMAFPSIANTGDSPVFFTMASEGQTSSPVFGFTLLDSGGELFLGGTDTSAFSGSLTEVSLIGGTPAFWEISAGGATVGGKRVAGTNDAIADTGTTLLIMDTQSAAAVYAAIPGSADASNTVGEGFFSIPCNSVPNDVAITLGGKSFTVSSDSLNFGQVSEGSSDCVGGIIGDDSEGFWILGDVFLRNVYTQFDTQNLRLGFAPVA